MEKEEEEEENKRGGKVAATNKIFPEMVRPIHHQLKDVKKINPLRLCFEIRGSGQPAFSGVPRKLLQSSRYSVATATMIQRAPVTVLAVRPQHHSRELI